jgi:hypothetical protein
MHIGPNKASCECGHGKTIHYPLWVKDKFMSICRHPECKCKEYRPVQSIKKSR